MNSARCTIIVNKSLTPTIADVARLSCAIISLTPRKPKSIPEAVAEAGRGCVAIDCLSLCVCLQVWNHNLVMDTFLGQMSVPIPGDGESHSSSERSGKNKFTASCCSVPFVTWKEYECDLVYERQKKQPFSQFREP